MLLKILKTIFLINCIITIGNITGAGIWVYNLDKKVLSIFLFNLFLSNISFCFSLLCGLIHDEIIIDVKIIIISFIIAFAWLCNAILLLVIKSCIGEIISLSFAYLSFICWVIISNIFLILYYKKPPALEAQAAYIYEINNVHSPIVQA